LGGEIGFKLAKLTRFEQNPATVRTLLIPQTVLINGKKLEEGNLTPGAQGRTGGFCRQGLGKAGLI
jgi:hypothetical protein